MEEKLEINVLGSKWTPVVMNNIGPLHMNVESAQNESIEMKKEQLRIQILSSVAGARGKSIYDIAVENGFIGTEEEFLEWFRTPIVQATGNSETDVMSQKAVTEELDSLKNAVFPIQLTFTRSGSSPIEYTGSDANVTLSWTVKRKGEALTPTSVKINNVAQTAASSGSTTVSVNALGTTTFNLEVVADNLTATETTSVATVLPIYMGFYMAGSNVNAMKSSLTKYVKSSPAGSYTLTNNLNTKYLTICIPSTMNINTVKSSGFDVPMQRPVADTSMNIGGQTRSYKIYRSASTINTGSMSIVIA